MKPCGRFPLVSPWLYRLRVRRAASRAAAGSLPAVLELAAVWCTASVPGARELAGQGLLHLADAEQAGLLCRESLLRDDGSLEALARSCGYIPSGPEERALWFFCTSQTDELRLVDPEDQCPLLAAGYYGAPAPVRLRALCRARTNGSCSLLARALAGPAASQHAGGWSYDEWDVVISGLISDRRWDDLWILAPLAPAPLAVTALAALKGSGWAPAGDDRIPWSKIMSCLPDCWEYPHAGGRPLPPVQKPAGQVARVCFSPDGALLATGSRDGTIAVRRTASAGSAAGFSAGTGAVRFIGIAAGNSRLVSCGEDGMVRSHGLFEDAGSWSWECPGQVTALAVSPSSPSVSIGDEEGCLHVLGLGDGRPLHSFRARPSPVTCITRAPGGSPVACGHEDGTVSVICTGEDSIPRFFSGNGSPVVSLAFSPEGTGLLVLYGQAPPALLDPESGARTRVFTGHEGTALCSAVSAEGGWFTVWSSDHTLRSWSWREPGPAGSIPLVRRNITCFSATADGGLLAIGFQDGKVRVCRMPGLRLLVEFRGHKKPVTACTLSPDGSRLATVGLGGTCRLWRLPEGEIVRTLDAHAGGIVSLAGPAGTLIATVTEDGTARVLDGSNGTLIGTMDLYTPSVRTAALSPDGRYLAIGGADASLRIWSVRDGSLAAAADPLSTSHRCCTFLPDGSSLVAGGWDGSCRIFRVPDAHLLRTLNGHSSVVTCCTVSQNGSLLVTGSNDTTVRLWNMAEDEAYGVLCGFRSEVGAVALSPDETLLAAGSADGKIRLWRLPYGDCIGELPGVPWKVTALAFTRDGCMLAAGSGRGTCTIILLPERAVIRTLHAHAGGVTGIAALPDGRTLVTTGADGVCRFHPLPLLPFPARAGPADIRPAASGEENAGGGSGDTQRAFLCALLSARFRGEIGICPPLRAAGQYDIQIAG